MLHVNVSESAKLSPAMAKGCDVLLLVRLESICCRPSTVREGTSRHDEVQMEVNRKLCNCRDYIFN